MNLNAHHHKTIERYEAETINEFKKKVKEFGDRDVFITVFLYREDDLDNPALLLESKHVKYERKIGLWPAFTKSEQNIYREMDRYHLFIRDLFFDFKDEWLSPKLKELQYLDRHPEDMLKEDWIYFTNLAVIKEKISDLFDH